MRRIRPLVAFALLVAAAPGRADDPPAKPKLAPPPAAPQFDFGFLDGSNVKVVVLEPAIGITTKYGKLVVPLAELKKVELGFRYPPGVESKLTAAVEKLAAAAYAEREEAGLQIYELKLYAGPMLKRAAADANPERRQRAAVLLETVRRTVPAERVDAKDYDTVETAEFQLRGRLDAPSLKIRTKQFGEAEVSVAELRQFRSVAEAAPSDELTLDAAAFSKLNSQAWLDTKVDVVAGSAVAVTCSGTIDQWPQEPGRYTSGPAGNGNPAPNQRGVRVFGPNQVRTTAAMSGAVVGKLGENGQPFLIGPSLKWDSAPEAGRLFLQIAPSHWGNDNATGAYKVRVAAGR